MKKVTHIDIREGKVYLNGELVREGQTVQIDEGTVTLSVETINEAQGSKSQYAKASDAEVRIASQHFLTRNMKAYKELADK